MSEFREISPLEIGDNPFQLIGKDWMLITAEKDGVANTMTASYGTLGRLWNKPVATIYVRPARHTYSFIESADTLSLTFFDEKYRKELTYMGRTSGRNEDKIAHCGFHLLHDGETPYFQEARLVLICRKLYSQMLETDCFLDAEVDEKDYPLKDYHRVYVVEILKVLQK